MSSSYDIVILGRGAAAFSASIKASELSKGEARIAMVGIGPIGGTCVNVGCVPSKYLLEASHSYFYPSMRRFDGVSASKPGLDFSKVMDGVEKLVSSFRKEKYEKVLESYPNVKLITGKASFLSDNEVKVTDEKGNSSRIQGKYFIIATGSRPTAPPIEGLKESGYIDSNSVWSIGEKPDRLAIIGGGAIGLELGQAFLHFGTDVTVIEAMPRIIPQAEPEVSRLLQEKLEGEGMKILTKTRISSVSKKNGEKVVEVVTARGKKEITCDEILVATGRRPNTDELNLEKASVKADERGFIVTDSGMRTSNPRIYAAGDCVSKRLMLETLAAREGTVAASNILGQKEKIDYMSAPWAVFTNPQVASVGYNEEEFVQKYGSCSCRVVPLADVPKAVMLGEEHGLVKLVIEPGTGKVVGLHVLSPFATEFVIEGVYAIKYGLTFRDIIESTHIFPTLAEGVKLSAQAFLRDISKMSCCVE